MFAIQAFVDTFDIVQQFFPSHAVFRRGDEVGGQLFPLFLQLFQVFVDVGVQSAAFQFVGLCEDDGKGYTVLAQPFRKLEVDGLGSQPAIYKIL